MLSPIVNDLQFKDIPPREADDILRLAVDFHSPAVDAVFVPLLIQNLRTQNSDIRLKIKNTLVDLQKVAYGNSAPKESQEWTPKKDESAGDIDSRVQAWSKWWDTTVEKMKTSLPATSG